MIEKQFARRAVQRALRIGIMVRKPCEICGNKASEAHHFKGYKKRNWLDVQWLCKKHHARKEIILLDFRDQVIVDIYKKGFTILEIAPVFKMSHQNVWKIISRLKGTK